MIPLITSIDALPPDLAASVSPAEKRYLAEKTRLPFAVTPHFASLARPEQNDPIRRQFFPDPREELPDPFALDDPLGGNRYLAAPWLIRQYQDRALLLAANSCAGYCRHCFRRLWLGVSRPAVRPADFQPALSYLAANAEIREVLVSGGDPLTLDNAALSDLLRRLRGARPDILLRVCTRVPITEPLRLDGETVALFAAFRPLRLAVHINHPQELSPPAQTALAACVSAGIPVLVQTVLMRGINDNPALLARLFRNCLDLGLQPYYLFQMDLAPGTAHFRVPLKQGLEIYRELGSLISGPALPPYAVDLPGGGGKIRLHDNIIAGEKPTPAGTAYILKDAANREWTYPA
ncbi:MAG: KamA family radical SAM protein [Treponema sp.]|jgi:lysine 2,3-aminomutase|nr:KamA family radical SAM protein [Treponema sp.]